LSEDQCQQLIGYLKVKDRILYYDGEPWIERQHKDAMIWVENGQNNLNKESSWDNKEKGKPSKNLQYSLKR
jgi:hypothetical protein